MKITILLDKRDLTAAEIMSFDRRLRSLIPELVGWTYSHLTGELTLDFGLLLDNSIIAKALESAKAVDAKKIISVEILDAQKVIE